MNTMSFGSFHAKHFNPDEVLRWKNFIFGGHAMPVNAYPTTDAYYSYPATDAQGYYADSDHGIPQTHAPNSEYIETFDIPKGEEDQVIQEGEQEEVYEEGEEYGEDDEEEMVYHGTLSKEAVEIFRFSEAYRKEREALDRENEVQEESCEEWLYNESTVPYRNGLEAPAAALVLSKPTSSSSSDILIQEHLLNSAYFESCVSTDEEPPVTLWPVLPLRL